MPVKLHAVGQAIRLGRRSRHTIQFVRERDRCRPIDQQRGQANQSSV